MDTADWLDVHSWTVAAAIRITKTDDETGKRGFANKQGKFVINPQFDYSFAFSDGLAAVRIGDAKTGKWGYVSR